MIPRSAVLIPVAVLILLAMGGTGLADGGFIGKESRDISEPQQKAVIFHHGGCEELVLSVRYQGAADEFAWLVPLPEPPRVQESDVKLFEAMSLIAPTGLEGVEWRQRETLGSENSGGIDVVEEMTVGPYDVTVVRAEEAGELREWLTGRGFAYDREAERVLADYIGRGWCFAAMRVNPGEASEMTEWELSDGTISPLRFTFASPRPVYPLYISSLNPGSSEVLLWVLGEEAYHHPSMKLEYAERLRGAQVGVLGAWSELAGRMAGEGGCYLTKLRRTYDPEEMEDLYLERADGRTLSPFASDIVLEDFGEGGEFFPAWAMMVAILMLAAMATAMYAFMRSGPLPSPWRAAWAFLLSALVASAFIIPMGMLVKRDGKVARSGEGVAWPWEEDILVSLNGWSKAVHPDGTIEVLGPGEELGSLLQGAGMEVEGIEGITTSWELYGMNWAPLDGKGDWTWRDSDSGAYSMQARSLEVRSPDGAVTSVEVGVKNQVMGARISPEGDRLWAVIEPGSPSNSIEFREYGFPSLELIRSIYHDYDLVDHYPVARLVLSGEGRPLLAGRFWREDGDYYGLLPLCEEGAGFQGHSIRIGTGEIPMEIDRRRMALMNGYCCGAVDGSPFLLLGAMDYETGTDDTYVFDTGDGTLYEVCEGRAEGWL